MNGERINVLLIEDNPADARLIHELLKDAGNSGFRLEHFSSLQDGLTRLLRGNIDIVLLDLSLPDSQGVDTFTRARKEASHLPLIVLTHLNDEDLAIRTVKEGAQDYLVKGYLDGHLLVRAIRYAIERKKVKDQLEHYAEQLRVRNAQMEDDLNMAREIQQAFLPHKYPSFPRNAAPEQSALQFSHLYYPSSAVGGDFFDVLPVSQNLAGLFICDVMGHGMRAALVTAIVRGLIEELMSLASDPGAFLTQLNHSLRAIFRYTDQVAFATATYCVVDTLNGRARYASAGHPYPLWLRRRSNEVQILPCARGALGPAMNLFEDSKYINSECTLERNDMLLVYTDGLCEVEGPGRELYGQDRLIQAVKARIHYAPARLLQELLDDAQKFSHSQSFDDDVCLIAMEIERVG